MTRTATFATATRLQQLGAAGAALAITLTLLASVVNLADGYRADEQMARSRGAEPAAQQVVVTARRSQRG